MYNQIYSTRFIKSMTNFLLVTFLLCFCLPSSAAFAAEPTSSAMPLAEPTASTLAFPAAEMNAALKKAGLSSDPSLPMTGTDMVKLLNHYIPYALLSESHTSKNPVKCHSYYFLLSFYLEDHIVAYDLVSKRFTFDAVGSYWASEEEFAKLPSADDPFIPVGEAAVMLSRAVETISAVDNALTDRDVAALVKYVMPEYSCLLENETKDAYRYWVSADSETMEQDTVTAFHEMTHEYMARENGSFYTRVNQKQDGTDGILRKQGYPDHIYITLSGPITITKPSRLPNSECIRYTVPPVFWNDSRTQFYLKDHDTFFNRDGIYGVLDEYYAYLASYRVALRLSSITKAFDACDVTNSYIPSLEFCNGVAKYYMQYLETQDPSMYRTLTNDDAFMSVLKEAQDSFDSIKLWKFGSSDQTLLQALVYC